MSGPLKAVSNVIELKPGHKYLLVFKGAHLTARSLHEMSEALNGLGVKGISIALDMEDDLRVIEVPNEPEEQA